MKKNIKKAIVSGLIAVFVMSLTVGLVPYDLIPTVSAASSKKAPIHINNTAGSALSYYQVNLNITYDSDMNNNFSDLRVKNETTGAFVPYWVEDKSDGTWCNLWFNATSIPASAWCNDTYYLYYGNASVSSASNGMNTFDYYEDFITSEFFLVSETEVLTGNKPFGTLLFDKDGHLIVDGDNKTWLYYTDRISDTNQPTRVRKMHVDNLTTDAGTDVLVKALDSGYYWNVAHLAIKITDSFYLMLYSAEPSSGDRRIRAANCSTPNGTFSRIDTFEVTPSAAWEGTRIEQDCGFIKISEEDPYIYYWILYYGKNAAGRRQQGWYKLKVDKTNETIEYVERYANNPLSNLAFGPTYSYSGGGNIDSSFLIDGKHVIYYLNDESGNYRLARALSSDEMFNTVDEKITFTSGEDTIEKFQFYVRGSYLYLIYEELTDDKVVECRKYVDGIGEPLDEEPIDWSTYIHASETILIKNDQYKYGDRCCKLTDNSSDSSPSVGKSLAITENDSIDVWLFSNDTADQMYFFTGDAIWGTGGNLIGNYTTFVQLDNGNINWRDTGGTFYDIGDYSVNEWTKLSLKNFDFTMHTYDIYKNDSLIKTGATFYYDASEILSFKFSGSDSQTGVEYWMDGYIKRKYASPEPAALLGSEQSADEGGCTTPVISDLTNSTAGTTNVTITWSTNQSADNRVKYSKNSDLSNELWSSWDNDTTSISIDLTSLDTNTPYYYQAWSYNGTNATCYVTEPTSQPYKTFTTQSTGGSNASVTVTDGSITFGNLQLSTTKNTVDVGDTQIINTTGADGNQKIEIMLNSGTVTGTANSTVLTFVSGSPGLNQLLCQFKGGDVGSYTALTTSYQEFDNSMANNTNENLDIQLTTPSSVSNDDYYDDYEFEITVRATLL